MAALGFETLASGQGAGAAVLGGARLRGNRVFTCRTDLVGVWTLESCFLCGVWARDAMRHRELRRLCVAECCTGLASAVLFSLAGEVANAGRGLL